MPGQQLFELEGEKYIGIGIHIEASDSGYFEAFSLSGTERTLAVLVTALLIGSALAALLAVFFGFSTSRGLLRPLTRVATTAGDIAGGSLDARLEPTDDPELSRLVVAFNNMADAVQSRIEREERFASEVSHELRSPITAMTAAAEVLASRRSELSERSQQALDLLIGAADRLHPNTHGPTRVRWRLRTGRVSACARSMLSTSRPLEQPVCLPPLRLRTVSSSTT